MTKPIDITGQRFGRLTVIKSAGLDPARKRNGTRWLCRCDCGEERAVRGSDLARGDCQSCGCLRREVTGAKNRTHGHSMSSSEYRIWAGMNRRCTNPKHKAYPDYGGRGIKVCERWRDFANFYADMGPRPSKDYSIDRIDNDGNYEPGNCQWATRKQQNNNQRPLVGYQKPTPKNLAWFISGVLAGSVGVFLALLANDLIYWPGSDDFAAVYRSKFILDLSLLEQP